MDLLSEMRRSADFRLRRQFLGFLRRNETQAKLLANSIPKSGTHLLTRCLRLFPIYTHSGFFLNHRKIGLTPIQPVLTRVGGGCFVQAHLPFQENWAAELAKYGFQSILMIRDPRDVAVSHMHYATYDRKAARFANLPDDHTRLLAAIRGINGGGADGLPPLHDIGTRFYSYLKWLDHGACLSRFENLIGPRGGGSADLQRQEIARLAAYLQLELTADDETRIAQNVYYPRSKTFRKGWIGDWKNHFSPEHTAAFKEVAGELLIDLGYETNPDW